MSHRALDSCHWPGGRVRRGSCRSCEFRGPFGMVEDRVVCLRRLPITCRICAAGNWAPNNTPRLSQLPSPSPSSKMASTSSSSPFTSVVSPLTNVYDRFSQWRTALGLSNPGTVENLTKEVKCELWFPSTHNLPRPVPSSSRDAPFHTSGALVFRVTHN